MNLIAQLQADVARHQSQLEARLAELKAEIVETRKVLASVIKYREKLARQHPNGETVLPLTDPEEEPDIEPFDADKTFGPTEEPLVPDEWHPGYEVPPEAEEEPEADALATAWEPTVEEYQAQRAKPVEPAKPGRRKAKETGNG